MSLINSDFIFFLGKTKWWPIVLTHTNRSAGETTETQFQNHNFYYVCFVAIENTCWAVVTLLNKGS